MVKVTLQQDEEVLRLLQVKIGKIAIIKCILENNIEIKKKMTTVKESRIQVKIFKI